MAEAISAPLSIETFRAWLGSRPGEEHWELIAGVPMMMAPATRAHQRIASNLESLLNGAFEEHQPAFTAYQRVGLNLAPIAPDYDPEPDVVVIDANSPGEERYADRFYLAAEVVSSSDQKTVESKREIYKRHADCRCVLIIRQPAVTGVASAIFAWDAALAMPLLKTNVVRSSIPIRPPLIPRSFRPPATRR